MSKNWNKNKYKGNSAENIFEFLINSMPGWECHRLGIENHNTFLKETFKNNNSLASLKIRNMPDFIVLNKKTGETFFVEVKYSSNKESTGYLFSYLENYEKHWPGTKLIIVRKYPVHFVLVDLSKLKDSMWKRIKTKDGYKTSWTFGREQQSIQNLFPDLKDESIEEAVKMVLILKT